MNVAYPGNWAMNTVVERNGSGVRCSILGGSILGVAHSHINSVRAFLSSLSCLEACERAIEMKQ